MDWREEYARKCMTAEQAAELVRPGDTLFTPIGGDARTVLPALIARVIALDMRVRIRACAPTAGQEWFGEELASLGFDLGIEVYGGVTSRPALQARIADYYPSIFSNQFNVYDRDDGSRDDDIDVFTCNVTPPDEHGYMHFGGSPWHKGDFIRRARTAILEVCDWLPNVPTNERVHVSDAAAFVPTQVERIVLARPAPTPESEIIAGHVNEVVQDGDTVQIGAGRTATALTVAGAFEGKRDLGWHSEITPVGIVQLMMDGTVNSSRKTVDRGVHVTTTVAPRTPEEEEWLTSSPPLETRAVRVVNAIPAVAAQARMVSINNAFTVDLTGQICSESLGTAMYNGTGGQPEFHIGAALAPGGKAITVLPSAAAGGAITRIVPMIADGAYVTVPRTFADHVITEHGIARLAGKSQRRRAEELIAVAHPDHRGELKRAARTIFYPGGQVSRAILE